MRIKYDVQEVEGGGDFDTPVPIGVYPAKIDSLAEDTSKSSGNPMLVAIYKISNGDWKGRLLWDYIVLSDAAAWKLKQFVEAVGLKNKGSLDTKKLVGTSVRVRVRHDSSEEFGTRAKVGAVLPLHTDEEEPDDEEPDDDEDDATEDTGDDEEITFEDLDEYEMDDLKELNDAEELGVRITAKSKVETVRAKVAAALELEPAEEDEPEDDDDDEAEEETEDYGDWDIADLKSELKERGLSTAGTKKTLVKKLEKDDEGDEPF